MWLLMRFKRVERNAIAKDASALREHPSRVVARVPPKLVAFGIARLAVDAPYVRPAVLRTT